MQRIGILGGTFNPIHLGHVIAAQEVLYKMKLDRIIFIPSGCPPHKSNSKLVSAIDRYEMVKLAIEGDDNFSISDIEIKRVGKTYTYDTLIELHKMYYGNKLYFIIGFDSLKEMDMWMRAEDLFKLTEFIVVNRGNRDCEMDYEIKKKESLYGGKIHVVDIPDIGISSTDIRRRVKDGEGIRYLVADEVMNYIKMKGLYTNEFTEGI